jgi:DNA polymerase I
LAKKKPPEDKQQSSLFSFMDKPKPKKSPAKKPPKKEEPKKEVEAPLEQEPEVKEKPKKPEEKKPIPKNLFFKGDSNPFGLKEGNIKLDVIRRESFSSKYIRYLKEKGDIVENLERGVLLDVDYDGGENKAYCKFYDLDNDEIKIWIDTTGHEPYCLSKEPISVLESNVELTNYEGFERFEEVDRIDLLRDKNIKMTKIYGKSPTTIGGSGDNIKNILGNNGKKAWEADIRYHLNYIFDTGLIAGLIYRIKEGKLEKIKPQEIEEDYKKISQEMLKLFKDEAVEMKEFTERNLELFLTPIPNLKRLAIDIEVEVGPNDYQIPDPQLAKQRVISISFVSNKGTKKVYVLEREGYSYGGLHKDFPPDAEVLFFKSEKDLLTETFRILWEFPIVITFNGDNFDLNYLFHRANKLRIDRDLNPIHVKRGFGMLARRECELRKGIHIDVFNFFINRSISGYAFGGAYERSSLNVISAALLGEEKYAHEEEIHEMEYDILSWYNLKDSILTLNLTQFNNNLVWNLIILLCRITKMPTHEVVRRQISTWIQNILYFEHRQKGFLIPRRREISDLKRGGHSRSVIQGKGFKGAFVIKPVPGIHFDVVVMDFASLYPTIIKEYNLSYETVQCSHDDCSDNLIPGIPYRVCTHKMGIFAYIVGFFRDIRVKYFKPKSGEKNLTKERRDYYTTIQQALKVFINGSYGVFGSENFPLYCNPVAESTTGIGRYSIKKTIEKAEDMDIKVLYGDTDSVFLLNPSKDQMNQISDWSKNELDLDLEEEKTYQFLALSERKKNYVGVYKDTKYVDIKGLVAKKRNTPQFIKKVFSDLIELLKEITTMEEFSQAKNKIVEIVRESQKKIGKRDAFTLEDYVINIGMKKSIKDYEKVKPQHVVAAIDLKNATGREYQKGEVVRFIKSKGASGVKAIELAKLQDIDTKKYRALLQSALEQVLDALGISFEEIKGIKKMDAFF